jgi:hypothetical protein
MKARITAGRPMSMTTQRSAPRFERRWFAMIVAAMMPTRMHSA